MPIDKENLNKKNQSSILKSNLDIHMLDKLFFT